MNFKVNRSANEGRMKTAIRTIINENGKKTIEIKSHTLGNIFCSCFVTSVKIRAYALNLESDFL